MRTRELARLIGTLGKLPREQRYAVATELASMQSRASSIDVIEAETPARPECPHRGGPAQLDSIYTWSVILAGTSHRPTLLGDVVAD